MCVRDLNLISYVKMHKVYEIIAMIYCHDCFFSLVRCIGLSKCSAFKAPVEDSVLSCCLSAAD